MKAKASDDRIGTIYFILSESQNAIKVGFADDLPTRVSQLQTGNPHKLVLHNWVPGTLGAERRLHELLKPYRTAREWYPYDDGLLDSVIHVLEEAQFDGVMYELCGGDPDVMPNVVNVAVVDDVVPDAIAQHVEWMANGCPGLAEAIEEDRAFEASRLPAPEVHWLD